MAATLQFGFQKQFLNCIKNVSVIMAHVVQSVLVNLNSLRGIDRANPVKSYMLWLLCEGCFM